jgi:hypothetical protein
MKPQTGRLSSAKHKSLFASFSEDKRRVFFLERKKQRTFIFKAKPLAGFDMDKFANS